MDEFDLIRRFFTRAPGAGGVQGPGDDAALIEPTPGRQLVATTDTLVESRHFPADLDPAAIGWRALAAEVEGRAAACGCDLVLLDHRFEFAQLWFYGDFGPDRLRMWMTADVSNHYELMWPFSPPASQRTLYVTERPNVDRILERLGPVAERDSFSVPVSGGEARTYRTFVLDPAAGASAG